MQNDIKKAGMLNEKNNKCEMLQRRQYCRCSWETMRDKGNKKGKHQREGHAQKLTSKAVRDPKMSYEDLGAHKKEF